MQYRALVGGGLFLVCVMVFSLPARAASGITERFTLPLVKSASINTYFDDNLDKWAKSDVTGTNCSIDITKAIDKNGEEVIQRILTLELLK